VRKDDVRVPGLEGLDELEEVAVTVLHDSSGAVVPSGNRNLKFVVVVEEVGGFGFGMDLAGEGLGRLSGIGELIVAERDLKAPGLLVAHDGAILVRNTVAETHLSSHQVVLTEMGS
jgi:hypothetical protein